MIKDNEPIFVYVLSLIKYIFVCISTMIKEYEGLNSTS
jgi:hypothetical protein